MRSGERWQEVLDTWFPPGLEHADAATHQRMFGRWFDGSMEAAVQRFYLPAEAALAGRLDHWADTARGRLALILLLDQAPRGLFPGGPRAYAGDQDALRIAEEGLRNGQYDVLEHPWERTFFFLPLAHAEGPDHRERLIRVGAMAEAVAASAPEPLKALYRLSADQARGHRAVIARFGRYPHRNAVLGRATSAEEMTYLATGRMAERRRRPFSMRLGWRQAPGSVPA